MFCPVRVFLRLEGTVMTAVLGIPVTLFVCVAVPMTLVVAAVIFAPSERPTARLVKIIHAWRRR